MKILITPVPKPRQTRADVWQQRAPVMRYRAFADELRLKYGKELPHSVELVFHMPMPKSWSKKKRELMLGKPHQQRPDWDNLSKAVCDALVKEDSVIWRCMATKLWAEEGSITIKEFPDEERW